jgi:uncharacterized repeat protein (TIGR01451 family)
MKYPTRSRPATGDRPGGSPLGKAALRLLLPLLILLPGFRYPPAGSGAGYQLQVLEMDAGGVVLELRLIDYTLADREQDGLIYQTLAVAGLASMSRPGQPQLPGLGRLLGTLSGGVRQINILETESETREGVRLLPAPTLTFPDPDGPPVEIYAPDVGVYERDAFFPGALAEIGLAGWLREQPVAQVRLYPFQYNPVRRTLEVYRRLRVQVLFAPGLGPQAGAPAAHPDTPYEEMLRRELLNYPALPPLPPSSRPAGSSGVAAQTVGHALKIFIEEDGLYRVTYQDLTNTGFPLSGVDPRRLSLSNRGSPVAIQVFGEEDGVFDAGDWLEFYGQAPASEFTQRNVYWLTVGDVPGLRMAERDGRPGGSSSMPTAFYTTLHREENHEYWKYLPDGEGQDHWFWEQFPSAPYTQDFTFYLQNIATTQAEAHVRVSLYGRTSTDVNPDHHTQVRLNGTLIHEARWDGQVPFIHEAIIPQSLLKQGSNTLTIKEPGDTGASVDSLYVNWFEIGYWDTYVAENDQLYFSAPGVDRYTFVIDNFSTTAIQVYDISDPARASRLVNGVVEAQGRAYRVRVADDAPAEVRYLALTAGQKRSPAGLLLDTPTPSHWKSPDNGADYLIITHQAFTEAAARLAEFRAHQGLRVATAQISDVYDEFSGGLFDPAAIRDFLSYAYYHWRPPAPLYVLLVGDANYDYLDYLGTGNDNYVPTHLFESGLIGQTPTDNWFVCISGDDPLPDMFVGRLSVRTLSEANTVVDKILGYEPSPPPGDWRRKALFVADDEAGFETISDGLIAILPAGYTSQRIYATAYRQPYDPTPDILSAIDRGALIVNYIGHGSVTSWGSWPGGSIFNQNDIPNLNNSPRYPLLVTGNCSNGLFAHPTTRYALAEQFVDAQGRGGIAAWSPTGLGYASWHDTMAGSLYQAMFGEYMYQLGPATTAAKLEAFCRLGWREPIEIFTLLGDPALTLGIVQPRLGFSKVANTSDLQAGQFLTYTLSYTNNGNQSVQNLVLTEAYDPHTIFYSASPPPTTGENVWQFGSLPPGASDTINITVRVSEYVPPGTKLRNQALLSGDGLGTETAIVDTSVSQRTYLPLILK